MRLFFDTSAFIKRYVEETGSDDVEKLCMEADDVAVSMLFPVEAASAFTRLLEEKKITHANRKLLKNTMFADLKDITLIQISPAAVSFSIRAIETSHIKTLDALHVGCAMDYKPDYFVSSDKQQTVAAKALGLHVKLV